GPGGVAVPRQEVVAIVDFEIVEAGRAFVEVEANRPVGAAIRPDVRLHLKVGYEVIVAALDEVPGLLEEHLVGPTKGGERRDGIPTGGHCSRRPATSRITEVVAGEGRTVLHDRQKYRARTTASGAHRRRDHYNNQQREQSWVDAGATDHDSSRRRRVLM